MYPSQKEGQGEDDNQLKEKPLTIPHFQLLWRGFLVPPFKAYTLDACEWEHFIFTICQQFVSIYYSFSSQSKTSPISGSVSVLRLLPAVLAKFEASKTNSLTSFALQLASLVLLPIPPKNLGPLGLVWYQLQIANYGRRRKVSKISPGNFAFQCKRKISDLLSVAI